MSNQFRFTTRFHALLEYAIVKDAEYSYERPVLAKVQVYDVRDDVDKVVEIYDQVYLRGWLRLERPVCQ